VIVSALELSRWLEASSTRALARAAYEAAGFSLLPIARYFRLLD
jgi:hypothetical protein